MKITILIIFLTMYHAVEVFALTGKEGGGGVGVLCKTGIHETLQLLDMWEAENTYNFGRPKDHGSVDKNLTEWNRQWSEAQGYTYDPDLFDVQKLVTGIFVPVLELSLSNDFSKWQTLPANCKYVQIAKFIDPPPHTKPEEVWTKSQLQVVRSFYQKLDNVNKAALLQHEFNYFAVRMFSNYQPLRSGSDEARVLVAAQTTENSSLVAPLLFDRLICDFASNVPGDGFIHHFYAREESYAGVQGVRFSFQWINGYVLPLKATAFVPGLTEADLLSGTLSSPIDLTVGFDFQVPRVTLRSFKIRVENSGDPSLPLKIISMDLSGNIVSNGKCN
jgi:hypothetical protein